MPVLLLLLSEVLTYQGKNAELKARNLGSYHLSTLMALQQALSLSFSLLE